jgi:AraC family transcriptional regulator
LGQSQAKLERRHQLEDGTSLATWSNSTDHTYYHKPGHHTLSIYTAGGWGTHRGDEPQHGHGGPGQLCMLPAGHTSDWIINDSFEFVHFYFAEQHLAEMAEQVLDIDPARVRLKDQTYVRDPLLESLLQEVVIPVDWQTPAEQLGLSQGLSLIMQRLLKTHCEQHFSLPGVKGGLAPMVKRLLVEYIEANLSAPLTISELAGLAHLSDYHFARMFAVSFAQTPRQYVLARRINRAKERLLFSREGLASIALECGFANQAHFTRHFRRQVGITPGAMRRANGY